MFGFFIKVLPKKWLSHFVGILVHMPLPQFLSQFSMKVFAGHFNINMEEAEKPFSQYKSIGDLFVRHLKPGLRPILDGVVHPADSHITFRGEIKENQVVYAKNMSFQLNDFLKQKELDSKLVGGSYITYYLCPTDYHRVHSPVEGHIEEVKIIPGKLWPVNSWSTNNINGLFAVNERAVFKIKTMDEQVIYFVMVGATNVGQIDFSFDKELRVDHFAKDVQEKQYSPSIKIAKGQDLGAFRMGSTVIMVYPKGFTGKIADASNPVSVRMGESLDLSKLH